MLSPEESRLYRLRQSLAASGITPEFGYRLAGFTDGEGCFSIAKAAKGNYACSFVIKLRLDDKPVLEFYASTTGLGRLYQGETKPTERCVAMPWVKWLVARKGECLTLVDLFSAYPLLSKKRRDFDLWAPAVEAWACIQSREQADWSAIAAAHDELKAVRAYASPAPPEDTP